MTNLASSQGESIVAELHEGNVEAVAALAYLAEAFEANPKAAFAKTAADWRQWLVDEGYTPDSVVEVIRQVLASELDAAQQEVLFNNVAAGLTLGEVAKRIHAQSPALLNALLRHVDHGAALQASLLGVSGGSGKLLNAGQPTGSRTGLSPVAEHLRKEIYASAADPGVERYDPNGEITPRDQIENFIGRVGEPIKKDYVTARTKIDNVNSGGNADEYPDVLEADKIIDHRSSGADPEPNSEESLSAQASIELGTATAERGVERYDPDGVITPREQIDNFIGKTDGVNSIDSQPFATEKASELIFPDSGESGIPLDFMKAVLEVNYDFMSLESRFPRYSKFLRQIQLKFDRDVNIKVLEKFRITEDIDKAIIRVNERLRLLARINQEDVDVLSRIAFEFDFDIYKSIDKFLASPPLVNLAARDSELLDSLNELRNEINAARGRGPGPILNEN